MARRVLQYFQYDDHGASTYYTPGHIDGGSFDNEANVDWETGMGGVATPTYGMVAPAGTVDFRPTNTTFLAKCLRATWTAPATPLIIRVGTASECWTHDNAYCNTLTLNAGMNSRLSATMAWMAITPASAAVPSPIPAFHSGNPFHWFQGALVVNSAALSMQDFTLTLNHNLQAHSSLDGKSTNTQRLAEEITAHNMTWTFSCNVQVPPGSNYLANWADLANTTMTASLPFTSATPTTMTWALTGLALKNWKMNFVKSDGVVSWALDFMGQTNTGITLT